jgi:hypothetical protein
VYALVFGIIIFNTASDSKLDKDNFVQIEKVISVGIVLVPVDRGSSIIRSVHYATQEYFEQTQKR